MILCDDTIKIVITPKLEKILGRSEATALQQLHFCLSSNENNGKNHEDRHWIYNTYDEWHEKYIPNYSSGTIQRAFTKLEKLGIVSSCQLEKNYGNRRKSYTINYDVIDTLIADYDEKNPPQKKSTNITPHKSIINTTQSKPLQQRTSKSVSKILPQTDNIHAKTIRVSSHIQPTLSGNALQMIAVWNEIAGKDLNQNITSYPKLLNTLDYLLENYFNNALEEWRNYCIKIASSKFLMGEVNDYRIRFSYATSENGLNDILYGDKFTFGDRVTIKTGEPHKSKSISPFEHYQESEQALKLREFIQKKVKSQAIYESWYKPTYIYYNAETNEYILFAPTRFMKDRITIMDEEIAGKFSEIHFLNGQYPEEYFGAPVHHENASEEVIRATHDLSTSAEIRDKAETSEVFLTNAEIYNDDNTLNIPENTTELSSSDSVHNKNFEHDRHTHGQGEGASSRLHETENAQLLRQILKEKAPLDIYSTYFQETFIFIDDNENASLFIKCESHKEQIVAILKEMGIIFSEISVPPEFIHQYYFNNNGAIEQTSDFVPYHSEPNTNDFHFSSPKTISPLSHKEITEGEGTHSQSSAISQNTNHIHAVVDNHHVSKCYDHHHKMIRWSQQNDMFLTKTFPKITSNIFSFRAIGARLRNARSENRKEEKINIFEKLKEYCFLHHFNGNCIKIRQNLRSVILNVQQTIGGKYDLPFQDKINVISPVIKILLTLPEKREKNYEF